MAKRGTRHEERSQRPCDVVAAPPPPHQLQQLQQSQCNRRIDTLSSITRLITVVLAATTARSTGTRGAARWLRVLNRVVTYRHTATAAQHRNVIAMHKHVFKHDNSDGEPYRGVAGREGCGAVCARRAQCRTLTCTRTRPRSGTRHTATRHPGYDIRHNEVQRDATRRDSSDGSDASALASMFVEE
jgi:hypothetical protein